MPSKKRRADHIGTHRTQYERNRKSILYSQDTCAICGRFVDKELKAPNPMAPTVDHIIPLAKGGHPSDMNNLQLAHWICNRLKSDKLFDNLGAYREAVKKEKGKIYQTVDWKSF